MPGRYIREGLLDSERVDQLRNDAGAAGQLFFSLFLLVVDDYGRFKNNPILIRNRVFPLRDDIRETDITRWLAACEKAGLIAFYGENMQPEYIQVFRFGQKTRDNAKSKYPAPEGLEINNPDAENNGKQSFPDGKQRKTKFASNGNGNGNGNVNEREARTEEFLGKKFPETVSDVLAEAERAGAVCSEIQAEGYLLSRKAAEWLMRGQPIRNVGADLKRFLLTWEQIEADKLKLPGRGGVDSPLRPKRELTEEELH